MLLHILVLAPFVAALLVALAGGKGVASSRIAIFFSAIFAALSVALIAGGDLNATPIDWFKLPGSEASVKFWLASNTLSAWMVFLSSILTLIALVSARSTIKCEFKNFAIGMLVLLGTLNGSFLSMDAVLFFFFFEAMVIPAAVLIASYGGENRKSAAMNFAIYTLVGSAPMCIALWYLVAQSGVSSAAELYIYVQGLETPMQSCIAVAFLIAFLVKTPIFPFHGWQAATYAEAPAALSAILTGAMSKVGVYGILVWVLSIFNMDETVLAVMLVLGLVTAVYGALMALRGQDVKKILAFSSMGHLGLAVAGIFTFSPKMLPAVLVLLVGHGLSAGALFFLSGTAERMVGGRELSKMGGLTKAAPVFSFLFGAAGVLALAVPGTAGFVGEFLVLMSLWDVGPIPALVGGFCLILSAGYMLRMIQAVLFGKRETPIVKDARISPLEGAAVGMLLALIIVFGVHPAFVYEVRTAEAPAAEQVATDATEQSGELSEEEVKALIDQMLAADSLAADSAVAAEAAAVPAVPETAAVPAENVEEAK